MFLTVTTLRENFETVYFLNIKEVSKGFKCLIVGEIVEGDDRILTYQSLSIKGTYSLDALKYLKKSLGVIIANNGGNINIPMLSALFGVTVKETNSVLANNIMHCYSRTSTINGYFVDEDIIVAISGYSKLQDCIRLFVGDILIYSVENSLKTVDLRLLEKFETASFDKGGVGVLNTIALAFQLEEEQRRIRGEVTQKVYFEYIPQEWLTIPLTKKEKKALKKLNKERKILY